MDRVLAGRLHNCLATILELEGALAETALGPALKAEFSVLKEVSRRLEVSNLAEQDLCRIEEAASRFLQELKGTLEVFSASDHDSGKRLLQ